MRSLNLAHLASKCNESVQRVRLVAHGCEHLLLILNHLHFEAGRSMALTIKSDAWLEKWYLAGSCVQNHWHKSHCDKSRAALLFLTITSICIGSDGI